MRRSIGGHGAGWGPVFVEELDPEAADEALDEAILLRLARRDVVPFDAPLADGLVADQRIGERLAERGDLLAVAFSEIRMQAPSLSSGGQSPTPGTMRTPRPSLVSARPS